MKISTILGMIIGFGIILYAIYLEDAIQYFLNPQAILIVGVGTFASVLISFSSSAIIDAFVAFFSIFTGSGLSPKKVIEIIVNLGKEARTNSYESLLLNRHVKNLGMLERGIRLLNEDVSPDKIETILTRESKALSDRNRTAERVFRLASTFSPLFGMIGTVIGMVIMINKSANPDDLPKAMGIALLSTLYGLLLSGLVFKPIASKIRDNNHTCNKVNDIIIEGVLSIQNGENSQLTKEKLETYLH